MNKISIRFYHDIPVRALWNEEKSSWYFSVLDVVGAVRNESDYQKCRNYWKYLKNKLKQENNQLVSDTIQLKLEAKDGKKYLSDMLSFDGLCELAKAFPSNQGIAFYDWLVSSDQSIDGKSKQKAYQLWEGNILSSIEVGTTKGLQQIHSYLFGGIYEFAGKIRTKTIAKGGFVFANGDYLQKTLKTIEHMPENNFDDIVKKYIEMNVAHPFIEGNGRATRIWLDLMLKRSLSKCVDWSKIDKQEYLSAMKESVVNGEKIYHLLESALTSDIDNREIFMKGIDYSYYYEEEE